MNAHRHDMRPDRPVYLTVYRCSSCAFTCTPKALRVVMSHPGSHVVVKGDPPVWGPK